MTGSEERDRARDDAFARLFDANWAAVRHHVEGVVEDAAEVSEIVSEVFLVLWSRADPERRLTRVRILRAADRVLRARTARSSIARTAAARVHDEMGDGNGSAAAAGDTAPARTRRALAALRRGERRIIMLKYWDDLAVEEIAELLHRPRMRIRASLRRAEATLRAELGLEGHDDIDA